MTPAALLKFRPRPRVRTHVGAKVNRAASWALVAILALITVGVVSEYGTGLKAQVLLFVLYAVFILFWQVLRVALVVIVLLAILKMTTPVNIPGVGYEAAGCAPAGPTVSPAAFGHGAGGVLRRVADGDGPAFTAEQVTAGGKRAWETLWPEVATLIRLPELKAAYDAGWDGHAAPQPETGAIPASFGDCAPGTVPAVLPGPVGACPPTGLPQERRLQPNALRGLRCAVATFGIRDVHGWGTRPNVTDHDDGLAVDVMIAEWKSSAGNAQGWQVARWFETHAEQLRVRYIIFDRKVWFPGGQWRLYTRGSGDPNKEHRNHVHLSFLSGAVATVPAVQASYVGGPQ